MKITLHSENCLSCGSCAAIAPTVFSTDNGAVTLKKDPSTLTEEEKTLVRQAAQMCPASVIEITEE